MKAADRWVQVEFCGTCDSRDARRIGEVQGTGILQCAECGTLRAERVLAADIVYVEGYHRGDGDLHPYDYTAPLSLEHETLNNRRRLERLEGFMRPGRLLDVGGGIGTFTRVAIERGWEAINLEPIADAIDYARAQGIPTIQGGVGELEPRRETYDAACLIHVLEHLPESRKALERVKGVIRPGGLVMVEVPNHGSMARRASKDAWLGWWPGQHVYSFTERTLSGLLQRAGFGVLDVSTMVLDWDGLILDHYAYILGLGPLFQRAVGLKRRLRRVRGGERNRDRAPAQPAAPPPLREQPLRRLALARPLRLLARVEEALGVGETLLAVGRVGD